MKGVAFELEFLVFLGKKQVKKISSFWEYFSSVVVFFLYVWYNNWKIKTSSTPL